MPCPQRGRASLMIVIITPSQVAIDDLKTQITELTEQVAALTARQKNGGPKRCCYCNKLGHTQRSCPERFTSQRCYICNRPGHLARQCWGIICHTYCPSPPSPSVTVPVIPPSLQQQVLHQMHDVPSAGYQGYLKTLSHLKVAWYGC